MRHRYISGMKTLIIGALIGVAANALTNIGGYFGGKIVKRASHKLDLAKNTELEDGHGHKITYEWYQTAEKLLDNILGGVSSSKKMMDTFDQVFSFAKEENIPCDCVPLLALLACQKLDITIIVDDSTSMGDSVGGEAKWGKCAQLVKMLVKFGLISENSIITLMFLNQRHDIKITDISMIDALFARNPSGGTPLIRTLEDAMDEMKKTEAGRRRLLYVFTDGIPDDGACYHPMLTWVRDVFFPDKEVSDNVAINFIVADTNPATEKEYIKIDDFIPGGDRSLHIDTNLSYKAEKVRCPNIILTEGLYKMKVLIGATEEDFDGFNESNEASVGGDRLGFLKNAWDTLRELNANLLAQEGKNERDVVKIVKAP